MVLDVLRRAHNIHIHMFNILPYYTQIYKMYECHSRFLLIRHELNLVFVAILLFTCRLTLPTVTMPFSNNIVRIAAIAKKLLSLSYP